jgi:hypothetical protein
LIDPNLGLVPYAPVLMVLACFGMVQQSPRTLVVALTAAAMLLVVCAQSGNVNHGGSPGMSRYALWLLALAAPLVVQGSEWMGTRRPGALSAAAMLSIVFSVWVFRPALVDRAGDSPSWLATVLWTSWPALDNPLPEVFAERVYGIDGSAAAPVATSGCEKVLIRGDGTDAWWPVPCTARPAPPVCTAVDAACFVNDGVFRSAPTQAVIGSGFTTSYSWTWRNASRLETILDSIGTNRRAVRLGQLESGRLAANDLDLVYMVEGTTGLATWLRAIAEPVEPPALELRLAVRSRLAVFDANTLEPVGEPRLLEPGPQYLLLPSSLLLLFVVGDAQ